MSNGEIPTVPWPSIGRIVIYRDHKGIDEPAIVRRADLEAMTVDIVVLGANSGSRQDNVPLNMPDEDGGSQPGTWRWPWSV